MRQGSIRSFLLIVVDGLGEHNLSERAGHARVLAGLDRTQIQTVVPSTTGAALTTITTGALPGEHGLIGYRIRHPRLGLRTTLNEWEGIDDIREWQRCEPLFGSVEEFGARAAVISRPAHQGGGLTSAILSGAEYMPARTIEDRFEIASAVMRESLPALGYLYVDELDQAAHQYGWQSGVWTSRLERVDSALQQLLQRLPADVGVALTADHGIIDVPLSEHVMLDEDPGFHNAVSDAGGDPRFRSLYLHQPEEAAGYAAAMQEALGDRAWVITRDEAIAAGYFGPMAPGIAERLGEVLVIAREQVAFYIEQDIALARQMIGQHGALTDHERTVPLALGGALSGSEFAAEVKRRANA